MRALAIRMMVLLHPCKYSFQVALCSLLSIGPSLSDSQAGAVFPWAGGGTDQGMVTNLSQTINLPEESFLALTHDMGHHISPRRQGRMTPKNNVQ